MGVPDRAHTSPMHGVGVQREEEKGEPRRGGVLRDGAEFGRLHRHDQTAVQIRIPGCERGRLVAAAGCPPHPGALPRRIRWHSQVRPPLVPEECRAPYFREQLHEAPQDHRVQAIQDSGTHGGRDFKPRAAVDFRHRAAWDRQDGRRAASAEPVPLSQFGLLLRGPARRPRHRQDSELPRHSICVRQGATFDAELRLRSWLGHACRFAGDGDHAGHERGLQLEIHHHQDEFGAQEEATCGEEAAAELAQPEKEPPHLPHVRRLQLRLAPAPA
mmetsp:Transcript_44371/g.88095  ORF Transcript_44371/g.88095 Transcript_44371/m.88095 type:complete len:272 (-) Transcript_44371:28-843(-)